MTKYEVDNYIIDKKIPLIIIKNKVDYGLYFWTNDFAIFHDKYPTFRYDCSRLEYFEYKNIDYSSKITYDTVFKTKYYESIEENLSEFLYWFETNITTFDNVIFYDK